MISARSLWFPTLPAPLQPFVYRSKHTNYNCYHCFTVFFVLLHVLSLFSLIVFFDFHPVVRQDSNVNDTISFLSFILFIYLFIHLFIFFFLLINRLDVLSYIKLSISMSVCQNPRGVYACHSLWQMLGCAYTMFVWSNLRFLHTQSCLVIYTFHAYLRHSFIMWLIVSSLYHHITYICCFVASYLFSFWYYWFLWCCFMLLLGHVLFPFLIHVQVLFTSYCNSVGLRVVSMVSGGCNQSSFVFFYAV